MKTLWNLVDAKKIDKKHKRSMFLVLTSLVWLIFGIVLWLLIGRTFFNTIDWFFCFVLYPPYAIGLLGGALYLYRHDFN